VINYSTARIDADLLINVYEMFKSTKTALSPDVPPYEDVTESKAKRLVLLVTATCDVACSAGDIRSTGGMKTSLRPRLKMNSDRLTKN